MCVKVVSCGYMSDFFLASVMRFFQVLSHPQRTMKIANVATLEINATAEKIAEKRLRKIE